MRKSEKENKRMRAWVAVSEYTQGQDQRGKWGNKNKKIYGARCSRYSCKRGGIPGQRWLAKATLDLVVQSHVYCQHDECWNGRDHPPGNTTWIVGQQPKCVPEHVYIYKGEGGVHALYATQTLKRSKTERRIYPRAYLTLAMQWIGNRATATSSLGWDF